ncbi:MAG: hypothetical protein LBI99_07545 [Propionibacteriaceae bacterium]|jgi:hypothetical protein|nr:hypothetical protein [Propionibacteriaceae bacterium]
MSKRGSHTGKEQFTAGLFRFLRGRSLLVLDEPENAVRVAVSCLVAQGFTSLPDGLDAKLRAKGSAWTAQAVEIGERSGFARGLVNGLVSETPLVFLPFVKRNIPPTLVMVAARRQPDGCCELVVQPLTSLSLKRAVVDNDDDSLAAPRVTAAIEATVNAYQQLGALVDAGRPKAVAATDKDCPAMPKLARALTGWR